MSILELRDHPSPYRKRILRGMFRNYQDLLRFYLFGARLTRVPLIGPMLARPILSEYGNVMHGGVALPLSEINRVIDQAGDIVAGECPCRTLAHKCDNPTNNCLKLNTAGRVLLDTTPETSRRISKEEAREIVARSFENGLLLQLEWCVNPYHYDICSCCDCCCTARRLKFEYGIEGSIQAGPYLPTIDPEKCIECFECAGICPAGAIAQGAEPHVSEGKCIGCGLCQSVCPSSAVIMEYRTKYKQRNPGSAASLFIWWVGLVLFLAPAVLFFKLFANRKPSQ